MLMLFYFLFFSNYYGGSGGGVVGEGLTANSFVIVNRGPAKYNPILGIVYGQNT